MDSFTWKAHTNFSHYQYFYVGASFLAPHFILGKCELFVFALWHGKSDPLLKVYMNAMMTTCVLLLSNVQAGPVTNQSLLSSLNSRRHFRAVITRTMDYSLRILETSQIAME